MAGRVYGYQGYKEYQFETSPKKIQPEYEPQKEKVEIKKETVSKKVKQTKDVKKVNNNKSKVSSVEIKKKATLVAYIVFGFSILFTISYRDSIINEKFNRKENLKAELTEIQKINEQLQVSVENELNLTNVETMAKDRLGMSKLSNEQKIYVNLPKKEYVESKSDSTKSSEEQNLYKKVINSITNLFK